MRDSLESQLHNYAVTQDVARDARSTREEFRRLDAEIERLRAALERIANCEPNGKWARDEARDALSE